MLDQLEQLALSLGMAFGFGRMDDLNRYADGHESGFCLWHVGYYEAVPGVLTNGALRKTYPLQLLVLAPSSLQDSPDQKRINLNALEPMADSVFVRLDRMGRISNAKFTMNSVINTTDRNLDGLQITLSLTTDAVSIC